MHIPTVKGTRGLNAGYVGEICETGGAAVIMVAGTGTAPVIGFIMELAVGMPITMGAVLYDIAIGIGVVLIGVVLSGVVEEGA